MKLKLLVLSLALAIIPSFAHAGQEDDNFTMTLNVEAHCEFDVVGDIVMDTTGMTADLRQISPFWRLTGIKQGNSAWVKCNTGLPYQLELDTEAGGSTLLTDQSTGRALPFLVKWGGQESNGAVWGQIANGEQLSGVGTGTAVNLEFHTASNWQTGFNPAEGFYTRLMTANLVF